MSFSISYVNKVVYPKIDKINVYRLPSTDSEILLTVKKNNPAGRSSGTFLKMTDANYHLINLYKMYAGRNYGYIKEVECYFWTPTNNETGNQYGNQLINDLVNNDVKVYQNIAFCASLIDNYKAKEINVSDYEKKLNSIIKTYTNRQNKIKNSTSIKIVKWFTNLFSSGKSLTLKEQLPGAFYGISGWAVPVAAGVVVGIAASVIIYYSFKPDYEDSVKDLKTSDELKKALASLSPQESQKLTSNLEKQIDDAYNQGKTDQSFSGFFGNLKTIAIILVGGFIGYKLFDIANKKSTK